MPEEHGDRHYRDQSVSGPQVRMISARGMQLKRRRKLIVVLEVPAVIFLALLTMGLPGTSG